MNQERIEQARNYALQKHGKQQYGDKPYIYHLDMVFNIAKEFNLEDFYLVASYLHDILEDTTTNNEELKNIFGEKVYLLVDAVTGIGKNRKEKKEYTIKKLKNFTLAINLKMIDRLANMRFSEENNNSLLKMYVKELDDYSEVFILGDKNLYAELESFKQKLVKKKNIKF